MFYEPKDGHGLPHNPFNAIVSPRPIGWISTRGKDGSENLAPYSFFNAVAYVPPQVMFASTSSKDSLRNIRETGVFCANVVETAARDVMNATSAALTPETDEFTHAGITRAECETIPCSRVANAPASLECRVTQILQLEGADNWLILGEVTGVHIREDCLVDGRFDVTTFQALSRLGYRDYASVTDVFELTRPDD
ncbi:flavin reductase family protein [Pseudooceanicola nanhaiensis]|uniref:flavin reductase family protein n=1 Tax=Pseudooceanicola nanhaiensis TaxID=375761 RepID=UPI001CD2FFEF|nr:flavin reductase family protein [Pseudooceanicola nanhaiensis]MCA0919509.1 flavin reductase family protein [Pseudooceanicola nanhaiensis]